MKSPRLQLLLVTLAIAVYLPILSFPFVGNSFIEIPVSRLLAVPHAFPALLQSANWHFRLSYVFLNSWLVQNFGFVPRPFYVASLVLHAICTALIYSLGRWRVLSYRVAAWAAAFFAIYEGHHAAVMALYAWPDLLVTLFACASLLFWIRWLQSGALASYALSVVFFLCALGSSQSGFLVAVLLGWVLLVHPGIVRRQIFLFTPMALLASAAVVVQLVFPSLPVSWESNLPDLDPWWITALWGLAAAGGLILLRLQSAYKFAAACAIWISLTLVTGALLVRFFHAPVQVSYLSSLVLALLVGFCLSALATKVPMRPLIGIGVLILALNVSLLWTKRRKQMLDLAQPTQMLLNTAAFAQGPIRVSCFPYPIEVAEAVAQSVGAKVIQDGKKDVRTPHCVSFSYKDSFGSIRQVYIRSTM